MALASWFMCHSPRGITMWSPTCMSSIRSTCMAHHLLVIPLGADLDAGRADGVGNLGQSHGFHSGNKKAHRAAAGRAKVQPVRMNGELAAGRGFEPRTIRVKVWCSTGLS